MKTVLVTEDNHDYVVKTAADILNSGGVIILPTDTVYGLASHPDFPEAKERIYDIKGREDNKPIAFLASNVDAAVSKLGARFSPSAFAFAEAFWPGALTMVVSCNDGKTEGLRIPDSKLTRAIIEACGGLLCVTSANISGEPALSVVTEEMKSVGELADLVLDAGQSQLGVASTVIRIDGDSNEWSMLREGSVTEDMLRDVLLHV